MFLYKITRVHRLQQQEYAQKLPSFNLVWTKRRPTPVSYVGSNFLMNVSFTP